MKKLIGALFLLTIIHISGHAQIATKAANNAFMITRMANKYHVEPRVLDVNFSTIVFDELLKELDEDRIFFTQTDITALLPYRTQLAAEISGRKTGFLQLITNTFEQRQKQLDTMVASICAQPLKFNVSEIYSVAEDTSYPANIAATRIKLYKIIKQNMLESIAGKPRFAAYSLPQQKKYTDSIEPILRHKAQTIFQRSIRTVLQTPGGTQQYVGDEYCKAIATTYDPHTEFFPATEKENFESELGAERMVFGFGLKEDKTQGVVIGDLLPGSPAYKSGQLNTGDKIESIQWGTLQPVDVTNAEADEITALLSASNHDKATFKIKKVDGTTREVTLVKAKMENDDEQSKVKSFLLKGATNIGYISLPAFYTDWENNNDTKGCANDVAKEIIKLKKENIEGLILDLRYNGGGSMQEAVELSGIFVDAGPLAMVTSKNEKVYTLKDANRGTIYDGPLLLMINGYSASASEMVAGTLQDYHRAIIMGAPSYGKATVQTIMPLDTAAANGGAQAGDKSDNFLKLTISRLYRVTGNTAQITGVIPDVKLPEALDAKPDREADNKTVLPAQPIEANKYFKPFAPLNLSQLQSIANTEMQGSVYFKKLAKYLADTKLALVPKDINLTLADELKTYAAEQADDFEENIDTTTIQPFTIKPNDYETDRVLTDEKLAELNNGWKNYLQKDAYLKIAYKLLASLPKQVN